MKISPARLAAFEILQRIETERAFSSALLPLYEEQLASNDRGLCHELVLGVLRRQLYLDKIIEQFAGSKRLDLAVRIALRLGIYQLVFLDKIPAYSAINESVNLVQKAKKTSAKGFVNAILRRASEGSLAIEYADEIERISVETSHPRWLIEKWSSDFGPEDAEAIAAANNIIPRIAFRITRRGRLSKPGDNFEKSEFVDGCYSAPFITGDLREMSDAGEIYFQDEASQLVAQVASSFSGERFLDVCAAPGGKTTQVADKLSEDSRLPLIVAGDLHDSRLRLLRSTCGRQGLGDSVNVIQYDAEKGLPFADESFDTVLVDAPCSGTGTIRHNPEIRYFVSVEDFPDLASKQRTILENASKLVRFGGRLIYSTCSLQIEENEGVCRMFEKGTMTFRRVSPPVPGRFVTDEGFARTFPHRDGTDGFFLAVFERRV